MSQVGRFNVSDIEFIEGDTGGPSTSDPSTGIFHIVGGTFVETVTNPATYTLTIDITEDIAAQYVTDAGTAIPALNSLNVFGGTNINTAGAGDTVTINLDDNVNISTLRFGYPATDTDFTVAGVLLTGNIFSSNIGVATDIPLATHSISNTAGSASIIFGLRARDAGGITLDAVQSDDGLFSLFAAGFDGTDYAIAAEISAFVDGTPGAGDMPGRWQIFTSPDGSETPSLSVTIDSSQDVTCEQTVNVINGNVNIGTATPSNPYDLSLERSVDGLIGSSMQNISVGSSAGVNMQLIVEPGTADPFVLYSINGAGTWNTGIDNSDSDTWKLVAGSSPSSGTEVIVTTAAGVVEFSQYTRGIIASGIIGTLSSINGTDGQVIIAGTGADPIFASITSTDASIDITTGSNTLDLSVNSSARRLSWTVATGSTQACAVNAGYFANYNGTLAFTLPTTAAVGDTIEICQMFAGQGFTVAVNTGETIYIGNTNTTITTGTLASTDDGDWIELVCRVADTDWQANVKMGNITVT